MSDTKVVILAAGKGKRMKADVPKALVKISGVSIITHLMSRIEASGVDGKPVVVVAPDGHDLFRQELGDRVEYALQREQLGTAHALQQAQMACGSAERILVFNGDHPFISSEVMKRLVETSRLHPGAVVMLTASVPNFEGDYVGFMAWGRILRNEQGQVTAIKELKDASVGEQRVTELNPSIYVFPAPWVWENLHKIGHDNQSQEYYLTDLVAIAQSDGLDIVTETVDALQVIGINTPEELARAEKYANWNR